MRVAVLGANGKVGRLVVEQAVGRGYDVVALVRDPHRLDGQTSSALTVRTADVFSPGTFPDLDDVDVVISAIGVSKGDGPGALRAGATALAAANVRVIWLGALGAGASENAGGRLYQLIMRMVVGRELAEKAEADEIALKAGAIVIHAPDLSGGPIVRGRLVPLAEMKRPLLPPRISRATLASLMLDVAQADGSQSDILVPLAA